MPRPRALILSTLALPALALSALALPSLAQAPDTTKAPPASPPAPPATPAAPPADWRAAEAPLLTDHVQITARERFLKAGEAYFDHASPPRWVVFQAIPVPAQGQNPDAFYSMYVARLKYETDAPKPGDRITGIEEPVRISPEGSANSCGWFHPQQPWRVLFGCTLVAPKAREGSGYRGSRGYVWQFPDEMDLCERSITAIAKALPEADPFAQQVRRMDAIMAEYTPKLAELRGATRQPGAVGQAAAKGYVSLSDELFAKLDAECPDVRRVQNWASPQPVFTRRRYDAECSYSPDGRFILYAHVRDEPTKAPSGEPKDDADLWLYDTRTQAQVELVARDGYDGGPFFSPDGKRICYRSDRKLNDELQVYVADLAFDAEGVPTGIARETPITAGSDVNWAPYWHPSGEYLVFASSNVGHQNYEVFAAEVPPMGATREASQLRTRRVTNAPGADVLPAFSDDGRYFIWTCQRGEPAPGETKPSSQVWIARTTPGMGGAKAMFGEAAKP
jgi:hypothetical protein